MEKLQFQVCFSTIRSREPTGENVKKTSIQLGGGVWI
jgi:hypothetical protein